MHPLQWMHPCPLYAAPWMQPPPPSPHQKTGGQQAVGTHPTGMYSCLANIFDSILIVKWYLLSGAQRANVKDNDLWKGWKKCIQKLDFFWKINIKTFLEK